MRERQPGEMEREKERRWQKEITTHTSCAGATLSVRTRLGKTVYVDIVVSVCTCMCVYVWHECICIVTYMHSQGEPVAEFAQAVGDLHTSGSSFDSGLMAFRNSSRCFFARLRQDPCSVAAETRKWVPPTVVEELFKATSGNKFSAINRATAGPCVDKTLPAGGAAFQLYSRATPNGWKVGILLEELGIPYDAHLINIGKGEQFTSGFVGANPNSKIPVAIDLDGPGGEPIALMESAAIMMYLCEKFPETRFFPSEPRLRSECVQWLMAGQGPMTGNFGHFMVYAPPDKSEARDYGVSRYGMEVQRLLDVLERHLSGMGDFSGQPGPRKEGPRRYLVGDAYTIADMACLPWVWMLLTARYDRGGQPRCHDFLGLEKYANVSEWVDRLMARQEVGVGRGGGVARGSLSAPIRSEVRSLRAAERSRRAWI